MRILLLTDDFHPNKGGIADVLKNLYIHSLKKPLDLFVLNPYSRGKKVFNGLIKPKLRFKSLIHLLKSSDFYKIFYQFIKNLLIEEGISHVEKIKLLIYPISKPEIFLAIFNNLLKFKGLFQKINPDIFLAGISNWLLVFAFILSKIFNKKSVSLAHGLDYLTSHPLSFKTYYFKNLDKIIVTTKIGKNLISKIHHLNLKKVKVIPLGVDINHLKVEKTKQELRDKYSISLNEFILLSVGRHVSRKNFGLVIRAVKNIVSRFPKIPLRYYLIGEGPETQNLKSLTYKLELKDYIEFLGFTDIKKRNEFYKLSDLFLMPSITEKNNIEGFGIVFLEANYFNLPVIGAYSGGVKEAVINGKTGFLIDPTDVNDLVEKILHLYRNDKKRIKMGERGHNRVIKKFNWVNIINLYENLFKNMMKN